MSVKDRPANAPHSDSPQSHPPDFSTLVAFIRRVHEHCTLQAARAVNVNLTLRNWVIGWYIREYEQNGADRAEYGANLLEKLAEALSQGLDRSYTGRYLGLCRQFFDAYPGIRKTVFSEFASSRLPWTPPFPPTDSIRKSVISEFGTDPKKLLEHFSFSHFLELSAIDDPLKRAFYEVECLKGNWSVRQLRRQIATLYFERSGMSENKEKLSAMVSAGAETMDPKLAIRDPYIFEFLGLKGEDAVQESELEAALVFHLRDFLLELGNGFCLEAQQKSITIGNTRGFVDLVFYHRILKCHVLTELKVDEFRHEHIGQLNTYVTWYRKHMMAQGDNPPIGLLLCTRKDHALVEYALAGIDNRLFVSKYQVELPKKEELVRFIEEKRRELGGEP
jgi:predicted nuclease of restriction endonuclease-like (RecB) superfamily